jgi:pimeloyl-ACP methyl ester carboxylesterase
LRDAIENWHLLQTKSQQETRLTRAEAWARLESGNPDVDARVLPVLFERGAVKHDDGRYSFSRDLLVKQVTPMRFTLRQVASFAKRVKCPALAILAQQGLRTAPPEETAKQLAALQALMPSLQLAEVAGNHHVHMNDPGAVAAVVVPFLLQFQQSSRLKSKL